jgi:hypothetical protein
MRNAAALLLVTLLAVPAAAQRYPSRDLRVLFLGNSLTYFNDMPWLAEEVAKSLGVKPALQAVFEGRSGLTLKQHWDRGRAVRAIREGSYAYVVLQPQSSEIVRTPEETFRYAKLLDAEIRKSGAKTIVFQTWAPLTVDAKQFDFNRQYAKLAKELGARLAPVGTAWESLRKQKIELFDGSGVHANLAGSYLAACVFVAMLYDRSPEGAAFTFDVAALPDEFFRESLRTERLSGATAGKIQREAWAVVRAGR